MRDSTSPFVNETLFARRASIEREGKTLNIWVSLPPSGANLDRHSLSVGVLYLIEDYRADDGFPRGISSYSSLRLLVQELDSVRDKFLTDPIAQLYQEDDATKRFASDPIGSLKSIGARFGPERHIDATYRCRASCYEARNPENWDEPEWLLTVVGYPLVIREI
jgi:hypothetical protein